MTKQTVKFEFADVSSDVANTLAESLAKDLRREVKDDGRAVKPEVQRTDPTAQDFGATLVLILGTPAIIILAKAVRDWAKRTNRAEITINGNRIVGLESKDVADIVKAINNPKP